MPARQLQVRSAFGNGESKKPGAIALAIVTAVAALITTCQRIFSLSAFDNTQKCGIVPLQNCGPPCGCSSRFVPGVVLF